MKKKLETLLREGRAAGNAEFKNLHHAYQNAQTALERAKSEKSEARQSYRDAVEHDKKESDRVFELLTAFRQAKSMVKYHRAGWQLAKHRFYHWLEVYLKSTPVLKKDETGSGKATSGKPAQGKTPTASKPVKNVKTGKAASPKPAVTSKPVKKAKPARVAKIG
ncbi:MAG: hypothetical protein KA165_08605 [Saprospiraceae bacterium]|nr:hypothetical protein [Saprospiraceae bacterium]